MESVTSSAFPDLDTNRVAMCDFLWSVLFLTLADPEPALLGLTPGPINSILGLSKYGVNRSTIGKFVVFKNGNNGGFLLVCTPFNLKIT
jgi:hypothetical protein